jgi:hypothetical protein
MTPDATTLQSRLFGLFRIAFGAYLAAHFAALVPYGGEIWSSQGMLPDPTLNPTWRIFPNLLALASTPPAVALVLATLAVLGALLALGRGRRLVAVTLWYGWACLLNRNVLISNPGIPYVGWLLLALALIPRGEALVWRLPASPIWRLPPPLVHGAWLLLALGYSISGFHKMTSPSWLDGSALHHLLDNPLARDTAFRHILLALPPPLLQLLSWSVLALESTFALLCLNPRTRLFAWCAMVCMHISIITVVDFADLTMGMLMIHAFTLDPRWVRSAKESVRRWIAGTEFGRRWGMWGAS